MKKDNDSRENISAEAPVRSPFDGGDLHEKAKAGELYWWDKPNDTLRKVAP